MPTSLHKNNLINTTKAVAFIKTRSPPPSLPFKGQVPKQTTVKWSIISVPSHALCSLELLKFHNLLWPFPWAFQGFYYYAKHWFSKYCQNDPLLKVFPTLWGTQFIVKFVVFFTGIKTGFLTRLLFFQLSIFLPSLLHTSVVFLPLHSSFLFCACTAYWCGLTTDGFR